MSPSTLSLPVMKAVMPSSAPDARDWKSSQLTLIVVSAPMSASLISELTPSSRITPSSPPKSSLIVLPGSQAPASCIFASRSALVMDRLPLFPLRLAARRVGDKRRHAYLAPMSYDTDLQLFIDGAWKSGEGRDAHTVVNPVTGSGMAEVPYA